MLKQKNLIFVGAPGAGKGTFSALLLERHPMAHISTGDILRDDVKRDTELGREAAKLMKEGKLVPDEVIAGMVRERLAQPDCDNGFILDGFPRTIRQAELLEEALSSLGRKLFMPPKVENVCDDCGSELFQRPDDSLETAKSRLEVFYRQTSPLIDYYRKQGLMLEITETDKDKICAVLAAELE